jgi:hypothetical protein
MNLYEMNRNGQNLHPVLLPLSLAELKMLLTVLTMLVRVAI